MSRWLLILRTVIWLRPIQIWWRIYLRLWRPRPRPIAGLKIAPSSRRWTALGRPPSMTAPDRACFLNREEQLVGPAIWTWANLPRLWLYNLHYFEDLAADGADDRKEWHRDLIRRWIAEHPAPRSPGWEPYPTSLRIVNWVKWALAGNDLEPAAQASLATQADWLSRRLEFHLLGNHLFANAKALVFAGSFLDGPEAARWLRAGLEILSAEVPEQVLDDGGHFERSVMYHQIMSADLLDLCQLAGIYPKKLGHRSDPWSKAASRMLGWAETMTHSDGRIAFFNDGAFGIAPEVNALRAQAAELGLEQHPSPSPGLTYNRASGYARLQSGPAVLFCDVAPIGPGYLPGHAHADTLSCELSLDGRRVFVNGGTSVYDADPERRAFERATAAHNTVEVDGRNSSEVWASFRAARRAQVKIEAVRDGDPLTLAASHDGYARIHGGPVHHRTWTLDAGGLTICDRLDGRFAAAVARYRLHPEIETDGQVLKTDRDVMLDVEGADLRVVSSDWAPEFGKVVPTKTLELHMTAPECSLTLRWSGPIDWPQTGTEP